MLPIIDSIVQSTVDLYRSVITNLAPTPAKSHYLFNLRDISKVINGILMFRKESFSNRKVFVKYVIFKINRFKNVIFNLYYYCRLWVHEIMREFYDRLIDDKDREWFFHEIRLNVNKNLQETFDVVFNNLSDSTVCFYKY